MVDEKLLTILRQLEENSQHTDALAPADVLYVLADYVADRAISIKSDIYDTVQHFAEEQGSQSPFPVGDNPEEDEFMKAELRKLVVQFLEMHQKVQ